MWKQNALTRVWILWFIQLLYCGIWTVWHLPGRQSDISDNTNAQLPTSYEKQCYMDLGNIQRFGSFYGIHSYYIKKGYLSNAILSIATFCSIDRLLSAKQIALNFNGPTSISVYTESLETEITTNTICNKVQKYFNNIDNKYDIYVSILYPDYTNQYYVDLNLTHKNVPLHAKFPINSLRNLASLQIKTEYLFCVDVDFLYMSNTINLINSNKYKIPNSISDRTVLVIPSFGWNSYSMEQQYKSNGKYLLTKNKLLQLIETNQINIASEIFPPAWKCSNYNKWYNITSNYHIDYCDYRYEPYIIFKTEYALNKYKWDNNCIGRSDDKTKQISLVAYNCFEFQVVYDMFIIHDYSSSDRPYDHFAQLMHHKYIQYFANQYCKQSNKNMCWTNAVCNDFVSDIQSDGNTSKIYTEIKKIMLI